MNFVHNNDWIGAMYELNNSPYRNLPDGLLIILEFNEKSQWYRVYHVQEGMYQQYATSTFHLDLIEERLNRVA